MRDLFINLVGGEKEGIAISEAVSQYDLFDVTVEELMQIEGVGRVKAERIFNAINLGKYAIAHKEDKYIIRSPRRCS
ncbi:hypothetical protein JCM21714_2060 [Gracilibacillus boraciitolerans JCM 21714]|uniref:Helix-hairpin-helix DNA-binding motif class 1 domain-containing protein n=1 Tax=Gracilibacillus boraciitolerans JCM 21714 TaxID=1298598 RepID=W4VI09_9BACI|nr:hypothetical protein JCM21714_2060 [Gracilibacillus boraciitolerans JCM 21714]